VLHGDVRTGRRILASSGIHAAAAESVGLARAKFITGPVRDSLRSRADLRQRAARCAPPVAATVVNAVVTKTADCKAAGTSSWGNSRLKNIAATDGGLAALTGWVQAWVSASVPEVMATPWRAALGISLRKRPAGDDVRPIIIGEALLSLPGACLQEIFQSKAANLLSDTQLGIGVKAAPETLLALGKALSRLCPGDAFCAFDFINAVGEISRAEIMEE
ncbi:unnamed protein product, partial [Prorocentrum cordatum]